MGAAPSRRSAIHLLALALLLGAATPIARVGAGAGRSGGHARRVRRRAPHADQPGLRVAHRRRRQPQRACRGVVPEGRARPGGASRCRCSRLHGEQVYWRNIFNLVVPNMFAGSILDLEPGTAYEARFVLTDPDGIARSRQPRRPRSSRSGPGPNRCRPPAARSTTCTRRSGRGRRSSRRSKASCAPTTTTAAPATPRRADVRASSRATRSSSTPAPMPITTSSTPTRPPSTPRRPSRGRTT